MKVPQCLLAAVVLLCSIAAAQQGGGLSSCQEVAALKQALTDLSRHVMTLQMFTEERARTDGKSGVKIIRGEMRGYKNYQTATHLKPAAFSVHDHPDYDRTLGIGEFSAVMNGVEFRTRHNDYKLTMPARASSEYHDWEDVPFPEVPPEVLQKATVNEQITELREWFKAFKTQNKRQRDYTKYFKPTLCYVEGAWTNDPDLEEPFPSDRHQLSSKSWEELQTKNRFFAQTGAKERLENAAFLPTAITSINSTGFPEYANWNYRILCVPIEKEIPLSYFHQETDLTFMVAKSQILSRVAKGRAARYQLLNKTRQADYQLLDEIFAAIPGKDGYGANLNFTVDGDSIYDNAQAGSVVLNTGFYHRSYKTSEKGAFGTYYAPFGFNDDNLWIAQTSQQRVAPIVAPQCTKKADRKKTLVCQDTELRFSYAFPLEVVYMTPLLSWNPYKIAYYNDKTATKDGRNGRGERTALNGTDKAHYYRTPFEFFSGSPDMTDPADTVENFMYILDPQGQVRKVSASGTSIILPKIEGVGDVRLRYPIAPVYGEGSSVWKELNALKDRVMGDGPLQQIEFVTSPSAGSGHTHEFSVNEEAFYSIIGGQNIDVITSSANGHMHELTVHFDPVFKRFEFIKCDGADQCFDGHDPFITQKTKKSLVKPTK